MLNDFSESEWRARHDRIRVEDFKYVIVTPAHNEEGLIAQTIESVVAQTVMPLRWVIVNDRSTDRTRAIAEAYARRYQFMTIVNLPESGERSFGRKALAFNQGVKELAGVKYEFIGNIDADMRFERDYFQRVLEEFAVDPGLGISGGIVCTKTENGFITDDTTLDSVGGAVQLFRKKCFEAIGGGYLPLEYGGIDAVAEITARMKGWKVRKLPNNKAYEGRLTGTADRGILQARIRLGKRFHSLGYGLGFHFLRCVYRVGNRPILLGGIAEFVGYCSGIIRQEPIVLPKDVVNFWRRERRDKIVQTINSRLFGLRRPIETM